MPSCRFQVISNKNKKLKRTEDGEYEDDSQEFLTCEKQQCIPTAKKKSKPEKKEDFEKLLLQTTLETQARMQHMTFPAFNVSQHPLTACKQLHNYPQCKLSMPHPIYVALKHCQRVDFCHRRTMARFNYYKLLQVTRTKYENSWKKNKKLRSAAKKNIYHTSLYDLAERLERHPDPYFRGNYDYYYTGGNVTILPNGPYVAHVDGDDLRKLNISRFQQGTDKTLHTLCSKTFKNANEIFEVRPFEMSANYKYSNAFLVRQRNHITLAALNTRDENDYIKSLTQFQTKRTPFISFAQSMHDPNVLLMSSMNQQVRWYDLNTALPSMYKSYQMHGNSNVNESLYDERVISWNTVKAWGPQTFLYANERQIRLMDLRSTESEWLSSACGFASNDFSCEFISSLACGSNNFVYVGTVHKLHCLDVRLMKSNFEAADGAVCRWTHQLEYAPAFMETFHHQDNEFIALASAKAGDLRLCELTRERNIDVAQSSKSKYIYKSYCLPYQPPVLEEAYESARFAGKCLKPDADLQNRIRCCTTGLTIYNDSVCSQNASNASTNSDTTASKQSLPSMLVMSNSNGDVFAHAISERECTQTTETRVNNYSNEIMCKYETKICQLTQPALNYTDIVDMKALNKVFRCTFLGELKSEEMVDDKEEKKTQSKYRLGRWQKSMSTLHSYKDALVKDLLSIWDIDYDDEKRINLANLTDKLNKKPDAQCIVSNWLIKNDQEDKPPMVNIPAAVHMSLNIFDASLKECNDFSQEFLTEDINNELGNVPQSTQLVEDTFPPMDSSTFEIKLEDYTITQMDSSALYMNLNETQNESTSKKAKISKKKSKYVKGF